MYFPNHRGPAFRPVQFMTMAASLALGVSLSATMAVPANAAPTQTAVARTYQMPLGDYSTPVGLSPFRTGGSETLIPIGDAALMAIKGAAKGPVQADPTEVAAPAENAETSGPDRLGLSRICNTNIATGFAPSDIHGAASSSRLVVVTNVDIGIYSTSSCGIVSRVPLKSFFGAFAPPSSETMFDPRVLYDRRVNRFFVTVESRNSTNTDQNQYIAVSTSSTASGWRLYRFRLSRGTSVFCKRAANSFWDYPNAGSSYYRWFITANDFPATGGATGAILSIDKIPSLSGGRITAKCFRNLQFNLAPPMVRDTDPFATFISTGSGSGSVLTRRDVRTVGTASGAAASDTQSSKPSFSVAAWTAAADAPQPNGQKLDTLDGRFQSNSIQSRGYLWNVHTVNSGGRAAIRWYRLRKTATSSTVSNTFTFLSNISTGHLFNPSIATGSGLAGAPALITASRTTATAGSGRAAHLIFQGLNNTSASWVYSVAGTSTSEFTGCNTMARGSCRWGDYSSTSMDPTDSAAAWGFNQLINGTSQFNWFTRGSRGVVNLLYGPAAQK
ncbi:MAG: hypothetical protein KDK89_08290 [Alphaproteobacteria bacterium]|nr:hypothetical protein [Alphaproteobacteria bacterium]